LIQRRYLLTIDKVSRCGKSVMTIRLLPICLIIPLLLIACDSADQTAKTGPGQKKAAKKKAIPKKPVQPKAGDAVVQAGKKLYQKNCTVCHGLKGEGDQKWRQRNVDGTWPAPPLNGSGHSWHHPRTWLFNFIKNGSPPGRGNMPAWKDKLSDKEIESVLAYIQSMWPEVVFNEWVEIDQRSK
jgi:mono/diheme cytochrome c family protein